MAINFEQYLPAGAKETMLRERLQQLAAEGLANQIAHTEATARGDQAQVEQFAANLAVIETAITTIESELG